VINADRYSPVLKDKSWKKLKPGTVDHYLFWEEQIQRCKEGWKPSGGTWMSGPYYFYLNFSKILAYDEKIGRKRMLPPSYRDQDHEYFSAIADAKANGHGLVVLKARRKGFSFMNANLLLSEWTLYPESECGVGSQMDHYVMDFRKKMLMSFFELPKEMRNKLLHNNEDVFMSGYKEKIDGEWIEKGFKSQIYWRVIDRPDAFRGVSQTYTVIEEAGEVRKLKKVYYANEECYREGDVQYGVPIIGGTSNQITNDSEDFMDMFYNPEEYNCKSIFIPASKVYHGFFNYKTGESDIDGATKAIERRAAEKKQAKDKTLYYAFRQEMPLKPEHAFMQFGLTPFDLEKINDQIGRILTDTRLQITLRGYLEWEENDKGQLVFGSQPRFIEDPQGPFKIASWPTEQYRNAHVAAIDPYHIDDQLEDGSFDSESKGCMYVYRRFISSNEPGEFPVAEYFDRPESKEQFYENCAMLCIYYDTQVLVEYNDDGLLHYFLDNGLSRYLKERPRSADAPYSKVTNRYGIHMKSFQKRLVVELIDEYVRKNVEDIYYVELLQELAAFGTVNTDRAMAFGMALIHDMDMTKKLIDRDEEDEDERDFIPHFERQHNGEIISINDYSFEEDFNFQRNSPTFDYDFDDE
jgi:hypothetical protein